MKDQREPNVPVFRPGNEGLQKMLGKLEAQIMEITWASREPMSVEDVRSELADRGKNAAYTTVMTVMNVMTEKGPLSQKRMGRAYVYSAKITRDGTQSRMVRDILHRVFDGSASTLVTRLLHQAEPDSEEMKEIRKTIAEFERKKED